MSIIVRRRPKTEGIGFARRILFFANSIRPTPQPQPRSTTLSPYAALTPADFEDAIAQRLLPRGLAWTRLAGTVLQNFWRAIADAVAAVHARTGNLTETESFPPTSVELLPDWETVLGLPDPCLGPNPTTSARQAQVAERLAASGGQSISYFSGLAQLLGAEIAVTEYAPFRAGIDVAGANPAVIASFEAGVSAAGSPLWTLANGAAFAGGALRGASWAYAWLITIVGTKLYWFQAGISSAGQGLWSVPGGAVACEIQRLAPAHTIVVFAAAEGINTTIGAAGPFVSDFSVTDSAAYVQ